jgi:hypothetical protein
MKAMRGRSTYGRHTLGEAVPEAERCDKQSSHGRRHAGFNDRWEAQREVRGLTPRHEGHINHTQLDTTPRGEGAHKRSVWTVAPAPFREAHFATFPPALIRDCILAGVPEQCCQKCGAPFEREILKTFVPQADVSLEKGVRGAGDQKPLDASNHRDGFPRGSTRIESLGFKPRCECNAPPVAGKVLDPFFGAGTTGLVAAELGRDYIGIELNPKYIEIAKKRLGLVDGLEAALA